MTPGKRLVESSPEAEDQLGEEPAWQDRPEAIAGPQADVRRRLSRARRRAPLRVHIPSDETSAALLAVASPAPQEPMSLGPVPPAPTIVVTARPAVRVSVVIPARNEAKNLPYILPRIPTDVHEVILVDGHSTDGTIDVARALLPSIKVVYEDGPGKGTALCTGFRVAEGDIIVTLDADGSTDPEEIPRFVDALLGGADFAKGSRFLGNGGSTDISRLRAFGNHGFVVLVRMLFGGRYTDLCYGYNAFWRRVGPDLALDGITGFEIETMMNLRALRAGLKIEEVPSFERSRIHGVSNLRTFRDGWRVLVTILRERVPQRGSRNEATSNHPIAPDVSGEVAASRRLVPVMDPVVTGDREHPQHGEDAGLHVDHGGVSPTRLRREG